LTRHSHPASALGGNWLLGAIEEVERRIIPSVQVADSFVISLIC
jgi:hypothetical protein